MSEYLGYILWKNGINIQMYSIDVRTYIYPKYCTPGPSCSKLRMSLVNVLSNLLSLNMAYMLIFLLKKCE